MLAYPLLLSAIVCSSDRHLMINLGDDIMPHDGISGEKEGYFLFIPISARASCLSPDIRTYLDW